MKRLPLLTSFVLFLVLCMSMTYWAMRFYKPKTREVAAPVLTAAFEPMQGQWGQPFGAGQSRGVASEYQLKGVVIAHPANESVAIFSINGGPSTSIGIGQDLSPGVALKEVHPNFILVGEGSSSKRVDLPAASSAGNGNGNGGGGGRPGDQNNYVPMINNYTPPMGPQTRVVPVQPQQDQQRAAPNNGQPPEPQVPPNQSSQN